MQIKVFTFEGTGAAKNIELGFIPDYVRLINTEDGDISQEWFKGMTDTYAFQGTNHDSTQFSTATSNGISDFAGEAPGKVLTGTFAISDAGTTVTGTNSLALTELKVGDTIMIGDQEFEVATISSATSFTVTKAASGAESAAAGVRKTGRAPGITVGTTMSESAKTIYGIALGND